jgi:hypothetical protein
VRVPFSEVLEYLESHGWVLVRVWPPYRVFLKGESLPLLVRVEDKAVSTYDFAKIRQIVAAAEQGEP